MISSKRREGGDVEVKLKETLRVVPHIHGHPPVGPAVGLTRGLTSSPRDTQDQQHKDNRTWMTKVRHHMEGYMAYSILSGCYHLNSKGITQSQVSVGLDDGP